MIRNKSQQIFVLINKSWRRLMFSSSEDVFITSSRYLHQDEYISKRFQDVLKTLSRRLAKASSRCLAKRSSRHLQDVFKMYHQVSIKYVFETYCEDDYVQKDLPESHFWNIYDQGVKFSRMNSLDIPKLSKQFSKHFMKWLDVIVTVGYQKICCCLSKQEIIE